MKRCAFEPDALASLVGIPDHLADHWSALCWEAAQYRRLKERFEGNEVVQQLRTHGSRTMGIAAFIEGLLDEEGDE